MAEKEDDVLRLIQKVEGAFADLDKEIERKQAEMRPMDRLVSELEKGRVIVRKRKRPKMHHATRRKKRRMYYAKTEAPRRKKRLAAQLSEGAPGWYRYLRKQWLQQKIKVELTEEQFAEVLWPVIDGYVFSVRRYDFKKGIDLHNIWVEDIDTGNVLFDGKEHVLRELGMIL